MTYLRAGWILTHISDVETLFEIIEGSEEEKERDLLDSQVVSIQDFLKRKKGIKTEE